MVIALVILLILVLIVPVGCTALMVSAVSLPAASPKAESVYQSTIEAVAREIELETTSDEAIPALDWQQVLVIDAVRREQQLEEITETDVGDLVLYFVERHEREVEDCEPAADAHEEPSCTTRTIVWYTANSFAEVMSKLGFTDEQREWAELMWQATQEAVGDQRPQ